MLNNDELKKNILNKIEHLYVNNELLINKKKDDSLVTNVDHVLSDVIKEFWKDNFSNDYQFFSEEDHDKLDYPSMIVDPIDGTSMLARGYDECSISVALVENNKLDGQGWIFNPFTGFSISSQDKSILPKNQPGFPLLGLVSRSEYFKNLHDYKNEKIQISPKGSIAYKLGLLASGACHFIVTKKPKSIWDIAGGTILLKERGFKIYNKEGEMKEFNKILINPPLLWCREEDYEYLREVIFS